MTVYRLIACVSWLALGGVIAALGGLAWLGWRWWRGGRR